jgi:PhzF family phenazine biosynthesis protein
MTTASLHRYSAFSSSPDGGNPAGVWIGNALPGAAVMQGVAAEVGYSETAFVAPAEGTSRTVRYYSPEAEVSFCGHATIAVGVVLGEAEGDGLYHLATAVGDVPVSVRTRDGIRETSLTSVEPVQSSASDSLVENALSALGWMRADLDRSIPPVRAYAGAWHLVLAAAEAGRLAELQYDFDRLKSLMLDEGLTTATRLAGAYRRIPLAQSISGRRRRRGSRHRRRGRGIGWVSTRRASRCRTCDHPHSPG